MSESYRTIIDLGILHLAESTLFALVVIALVYAFRIQSGNSRFLYHQIAILKFLLPIGAFASLYFDTKLLQDTPIVETSLETITQTSSLIQDESNRTWALVALGVWIAGFAVIGIARVIACYRSLGLGRSIQNTSKQINRASLQAGALDSSTPPIYEEDRISSIGLVGFFRPRIIVNAAFLETLSDKELLAAIRHERAHAQRHDNLWRIAHEFVACLFWFNPIIWVLRNRLRTESELACDEIALEQGEEPQSYAKCLLKAASLNSRYTSVWVTSFSATSLKRRIRKITTFENNKESKMKILMMHLSLLCMLGLITATSSSLRAADPGTDDAVYKMSDLDKKPKAIEMFTPVYPKELHDKKVPGKAVVEWVLDKNGEVHAARAIKSTHAAFEQPSVDAVYNTKWAPGEIDGKPVSVLIRMPIKFEP